MKLALAPKSGPDPEAVLAKATVRAASQLGVRQGELAAMIGVSAAAVSRAGEAGSGLFVNAKAQELSTLFVRVFRSLDALVGGDAQVAARWLREPNLALGGKPVELMKTVAGLTTTLAYLDARRAVG